MESELLTVSEVSETLRVDDTTVRRWIKQGALKAVILPHVRERQAYRIHRATLDKLLCLDTSEAPPKSSATTTANPRQDQRRRSC